MEVEMRFGSHFYGLGCKSYILMKFVFFCKISRNSEISKKSIQFQ